MSLTERSFGNHKSDRLSQLNVTGSAHDWREEANLGRVDPFQDPRKASVGGNEAIDGISAHRVLNGVIEARKGTGIRFRACNGYGELAEKRWFNSP